MERADKIRDIGNHLMQPVLSGSLQELMSEYKKREEALLKELSSTLQQLIDITAKQQAEGVKGRACYLGICYCRSSVFTGIHKIKLDIYDEELYLDETECSLFWKPDFIFDFYRRDMQCFCKCIRKEIPRVRTYEIQQYGMGYWRNYLYILSEFLRQKLPEVIRQISLEGIQAEEKFQVLWGEYMGRGTVLYEEKWDELFSDKQ